MTLSYEDWIEENKNEKYPCYGKKSNSIKHECLGRQQEVSHIEIHDQQTVKRIYQNYVDAENDKEEAKRKERGKEERIIRLENFMEQANESMKIRLQNKNNKEVNEDIENEVISNTTNSIKMITCNSNSKSVEYPRSSKNTSLDQWLKAL